MLFRSRSTPDQSYTAPGSHTTAAAIGKQYKHEFPLGADPDKKCTRESDGSLSSGTYVAGSEALKDHVTPRALQIDFHHPLEDWIGTRPFRWLLRRLSKPRPGGKTTLENIIESYGEAAPCASTGSGEPRTSVSGQGNLEPTYEPRTSASGQGNLEPTVKDRSAQIGRASCRERV